MALAQQVPTGARFADVGTDHARLPVWLLQEGVIDRAIATDISGGPLDRARKTAAHYGYTQRISFRLGDGLGPLQPGEADVIAIAGMGGETIADILTAAPWLRTEAVSLLLQSMTSTFELRRRLDSLGLRIVRETLVKEERTIYVLLTAEYGTAAPLSLAEAWVGRQREGMDSPLRGEYLAVMLDRGQKALEGLLRSARPSDLPRREEMEALCRQLAPMKEEWDRWQR